MIKKYLGLIWMISLFLLFTGNPVVYGHDGEEFGVVTGDAWMDNYTLVITDAKTIDEAYQAADAIEKAGGHVGVIIPNQVMLGWVPKDSARQLVGRSKIKAIHHTPLSDSSVKGLASSLSKSSIDPKMDESKENAIQFFNKVVRGHYKLKKAQQKAQMEASGAQPHMLADELEAPPISHRDYMYNLIANGITQEDLRKAGIYPRQSPSGDLEGSPGNSDYMVGKALFNAIFVESNGAIDANTYTWTAGDRALIEGEITAGLSWWANTAFNFDTYKTPLTWVIVFRWGALTNTSYEPITHAGPSADYLWINQIMALQGYGAGDKFARTTAFNTAQRTAWNTNWATTSFIAYNPGAAPTTFTDGYFAYAYIGGPYSQLCFRNNGWGTGNYDIVNAHETGHLHGARDEYAASGCDNCATEVTNAVWNGNCENCNANVQPCMMKSNSLALCGYTPGQLGWRGAQYVDVSTRRSDNGNFKNFFAPGEAIQYRINYCIAGPKVGANTHDVRVRARIDCFDGTVGAPATAGADSGWIGAGSISPPDAAGLSCWYTWMNWATPAAGKHGPCTVSMQLDLDNLGKAAASQYSKIWMAENADTTQPSPDPALTAATAGTELAP